MIFIFCLCVYLPCAQVSPEARREVSDSLELEFQVVGSLCWELNSGLLVEQKLCDIGSLLLTLCRF